MIRRVVITLAVATLMITGCGDDSPTESSRPTGPQGTLFVLNQTDATMYVYDTKTMTRIDSVDTRVSLPHYVELSPDGQFLYISTLENTGHLATFNATTHAFVDSATVPPAVRPSAIAITADGLYGYVCNFSTPSARTWIHKFDLSALQTVDSMQAGAITHDIKMTSDGAIAIACNRNSDDLTLVHTDGDTVSMVSIDPDSVYGITGSPKYGPFGVAIDSRDSLAFIACMDARQVRVLDIAAKQIVDSIDIPITPSGFISGPTLLAVHPNNNIVFVTTQGGNSVVAFRVDLMQVVAEFDLGTPNPFGITMASDGNKTFAYVACMNGPGKTGMIYAFDADNLTKVDSIAVGKESFGLVWRQ